MGVLCGITKFSRFYEAVKLPMGMLIFRSNKILFRGNKFLKGLPWLGGCLSAREVGGLGNVSGLFQPSIDGFSKRSSKW